MIDDCGWGLYRDLLYYYGVDLRDVVRGNGPAPAFVISLIDGLPLGSMSLSMRIDEDDWYDYFGKDHDWYLNADIFDVINQNTRATGQWKKGKAPTFEPYPRPGSDKKKKAKKAKSQTLDGLFAQLNRR